MSSTLRPFVAVLVVLVGGLGIAVTDQQPPALAGHAAPQVCTCYHRGDDIERGA